MSESAVTLCLATAAECPDQSPELQPWSPGHDPDYVAQVGHGTALLLTASATVNSLHITDGGKCLRQGDTVIVLAAAQPRDTSEPGRSLGKVASAQGHPAC